LASSTLVDDPKFMGTNGNVAQLIVAANAVQSWQGGKSFFLHLILFN
jgi:hypothetical protein